MFEVYDLYILSQEATGNHGSLKQEVSHEEGNLRTLEGIFRTDDSCAQARSIIGPDPVEGQKRGICKTGKKQVHHLEH